MIPFIENEGGPDVTEQIEKFEAKSEDAVFEDTERGCRALHLRMGFLLSPEVQETRKDNNNEICFSDICEYLFPQDEILLCAPTGKRAARRLTESTGRAGPYDPQSFESEG